MKRRKKKTTVIFTRVVDPENKRYFKDWCSRRGKTMNDAISGFVKQKAREERRLQQ